MNENTGQGDAPVYGLILAGGYSSRMGTAKSHITYHGMPQYQYLHELLKDWTDDVFISCRPEQQFGATVSKISDAYPDIGPLAGVLSAFEHAANSAWLVVACDLPFANKESISFLLKNRDATRHATFFKTPETDFPEPLFALYEPSVFPVLQKAYQEKQYSLNRILQSVSGHALIPSDPKWIVSANTPEEVARIKSLPR